MASNTLHRHREPAAAPSPDGHLRVILFQLGAMLLAIVLAMALWERLPATGLLWWLGLRQGLSLVRMAYANACQYRSGHFQPPLCIALTLMDAGLWLALAAAIGTPGSDLMGTVLQVTCVLTAGCSMSLCWRLRRQHRVAHPAIAP